MGIECRRWSWSVGSQNQWWCFTDGCCLCSDVRVYFVLSMAEYVSGAVASCFSKPSIATARSAVYSSRVIMKEEKSESWFLSSGK